ncbi:MAG: DUF11 domain-containing protein, partial [Thermoplasmata archaeon]|nr:DUF11 domain-containing protein [Thermoplasmata archaeon]
WVLGSIAAGGSAAIVITVNVNLGLAPGDELVNDVTADYDNAAAIVLPTESDIAITTIIDPVIVITKTGPAIAAPGEIIMYMITVVNTGTDIAYNVVITDTYPAGTTYINSTYPPDIGDNIWNAGNLLPGEGGVVFINVSVDAGTLGNITNLVEADYLNGVFIGMYTNASWTTLITGPFLSIQKTGPATATEGADITYTIVVNNTGDNDAYNVIVTETYPANVTFVSADLAPTSGNDTWDLGTMAPGDVIWINITVNVDLGATILINNVVVNYSSDALGNVTTENPASLITIINNPWVEITKTAPLFANWNETIMYTITYINTGNANASNIWINETYSTDVTFVDASPAPTSGNGTWYIPLLEPGESGTIFINVTVNYSGPGIIYNYVELTFENSAALVMPTQMAWANTTIINPLMNITKTGPAFVNPGETFTYFLNYENVGDDWAYDVVITEFYPAGINFVSSIPLAFSGNNVWVIPALAPGATGTIQITVTVTALSGTLFNGVEVNYNNSAGIPQYPVGASFETDIISPLMTVSKTAPDYAVPGEFITYTISYENTGDDWAYNVVVTEFYPAGVTFVSAV